MGSDEDSGVEPRQGERIDEVEPNDIIDTEQGIDESTPFVIGDELVGSISAFDGSEEAPIDFDFWRFAGRGGDLFTLEIAEMGEGLGDEGITFGVFLEDLGVSHVISTTVGQTRSVFLPFDGDYYVVVHHGSVNTGLDEVPAHGGEGATYRLLTSSAPIEATSSIGVPGVVQGDLGNGAAKAFSFTWTGEEALNAEVVSQRPPIESDADTVLYLWDVEASALAAFNDDIDFAGGNYDAGLVTDATSGDAYLAIVDAYVIDPSAPFELSVGAIDDAPSNPTILEGAASAQGVIADVGDESFDIDYFSLMIAPGEATHVLVEFRWAARTDRHRAGRLRVLRRDCRHRQTDRWRGRGVVGGSRGLRIPLRGARECHGCQTHPCRR